MPMLKIIVIGAHYRRPFVMNNNALAIAMERFHSTHIHRILIMAKIKFVFYLTVA